MNACTRPAAAGRLALVAGALLLAAGAAAGAEGRGHAEAAAPRATVQDFDRGGSPYEAGRCAGEPGPEVLPGGPWGNFLRLATSPAPNQNAVAFGRMRVGEGRAVVADFDMRIAPKYPGRADGLGFALLDAGAFGDRGPVCPTGPAEEPGFARSLGVGFDIYENAGDVGNDIDRDNYSNSVSVHVDGAVVAQADVSRHLDLGTGLWVHARVLVRPGAGFSLVSVFLTPYGGRQVAVVSDLRVDGYVPGDSRALFAARSGGQSADFDLDNVRIVTYAPGRNAFSLEAPWAFADEHEGSVTLAVTRLGDLGSRATVRYGTRGGAAEEGVDFRGRNRTVVFRRGEATRLVRVRLEDDAREETDETFGVRLEAADDGDVVAGPDRAEVTIYDDESARLRGRWGSPVWFPVVPVHAALLPTREMLFWDRFGVCHRWDPETGVVRGAARPTFNAFCAGQSFLADGRLFVAGGHMEHGEPEHDGVGIPNAAIYDPRADSWTDVPDMAGGRWYPTNTTLPTGDVLVLSGSVTGPDDHNELPEVWLAGHGRWRRLATAQDSAPYGVDLYPRMFVAPDGRVFKAGPDRDTWFLDVTGSGAWARGPLMNFGRPRTYGPAVMYGAGRIVVAGGASPPTATAEVIDLNDAAPGWRPLEPMALPRRHNNLTALPDGTVLVTGGTSGPGFSNEATPALAAELWDPATGAWSPLPAERATRAYHSVALLLPDGSVLSAGGGQYADATASQTNGQIYYPAYLFKGPRPAVLSAPAEVGPGARFEVETAEAGLIRKVTLVRLPSVTHAFDENQRLLELEFEAGEGALSVTAPSSPNDCPPGHYMLFVVDEAGVPSVAHIVRIGR